MPSRRPRFLLLNVAPALAWALCGLGPAATGADNDASTISGATSVLPVPGSRPVPSSTTRGAGESYLLPGAVDELRSWPDAVPDDAVAAGPVEPLPIYFPPDPPVLGENLPTPLPPADEVTAALVPFLNEPFYAPLSTRLAEGDLGRRQRTQLDGYRRQKSSLLAELRARLAATSRLEPAERERELTALAREQAPALEALEAQSDQMRRDFYRGGLLRSGGDWNEFRTWRLGEGGIIGAGETGSREREIAVLRAAVYYQEGLSPAQRRLLREIVMELRAPPSPGGNGAPASAGGAPGIFFSPATARITVPDRAPPALREHLAAYTAEKNALKRELREQVVLVDREDNPVRRARRLQDFALIQEPRLAALQAAAEELRRELAAMPKPAPDAGSLALPAELMRRIDAYLRAKNDLQRAAQAYLNAALQAFDRRADRTQPGRDDAQRIAARRAALGRFQEENKVTVDALNAEGAAIRVEAGRILAADTAATGPVKSVDELLREFSDAFRRQQLDAMYADYRAAVFEPGLSAAQRRLLFDGALVSLNPPGAVRDRQALPDDNPDRP